MARQFILFRDLRAVRVLHDMPDEYLAFVYSYFEPEREAPGWLMSEIQRRGLSSSEVAHLAAPYYRERDFDDD